MTDHSHVAKARGAYDLALAETHNAQSELLLGLDNLSRIAAGLSQLPTASPGVADLTGKMASFFDEQRKMLEGVIARNGHG